MKFDCVIFDLDGTLLDTLGDLRNALNAALAEFARPARTTEEVRMMVGNGVRNLISKAMPEAASETDLERALRSFREYYNSHLNVETVPYPGIMEMLCRLHDAGMKVCINSNKYDAALKALCIAHFDGLYVAAEGESPDCPRKPDPAAALKLAALCGAHPERTLYVGDSNVDVRTAANAGMHAAWVSWGFRSRDDMGDQLPENCFDDADALCDYILD